MAQTFRAQKKTTQFEHHHPLPVNNIKGRSTAAGLRSEQAADTEDIPRFYPKLRGCPAYYTFPDTKFSLDMLIGTSVGYLG